MLERKGSILAAASHAVGRREERSCGRQKWEGVTGISVWAACVIQFYQLKLTEGPAFTRNCTQPVHPGNDLAR